ncbi:hypothetical protein AAMO2058_001236900 [Amorphochlora amoebiformis]
MKRKKNEEKREKKDVRLQVTGYRLQVTGYISLWDTEMTTAEAKTRKKIKKIHCCNVTEVTETVNVGVTISGLILTFVTVNKNGYRHVPVDPEMTEYFKKYSEYSLETPDPRPSEVKLRFLTSESLGFKFSSTYVESVKEGGQAESLGVRDGWEIASVGGNPVDPGIRARDLFEAISTAKRKSRDFLEISFRIPTGIPGGSSSPGGDEQVYSRGASGQINRQIKSLQKKFRKNELPSRWRYMSLEEKKRFFVLLTEKYKRKHPEVTYYEELRRAFVKERRIAGINGALEGISGIYPSPPTYLYRLCSAYPYKTLQLHSAPTINSRRINVYVSKSKPFHVDRLTKAISHPIRTLNISKQFWLRVVRNPGIPGEESLEGSSGSRGSLGGDVEGRNPPGFRGLGEGEGELLGWIPEGDPMRDDLETPVGPRPHYGFKPIRWVVPCQEGKEAPVVVDGKRIPMSRYRGQKIYDLWDSDNTLSLSSDPETVYVDANLTTWTAREQKRQRILNQVFNPGAPPDPYRYFGRNLHFDIIREPRLWSVFSVLTDIGNQTEINRNHLHNPALTTFFNNRIPKSWRETLNSTSLLNAYRMFPELSPRQIFSLLHFNPSLRASFPHKEPKPGDVVFSRYYRPNPGFGFRRESPGGLHVSPWTKEGRVVGVRRG